MRAGGIYEYSVEDASAKAEPSLAKRTAKLQRQVGMISYTGSSLHCTFL